MTVLNKPNETLPTIPDDYADRLMAGVAASRASMPTGPGGTPLVKMSREGVWTYGQSNEEVQEGSRWIVNPMLFGHGWICWIQAANGVKGRKGGEIMAPMAGEYPPRPPLVEGKHDWAQQYSCVMKCMDGVDAGVEGLYKGSSMGGTEAMAALIDAFQRNFAVDRAHPCPVVTLDSTFYPNKTYGGNTYKPVFTIVGWADMNGQFAGPSAPSIAAPAPEPATAPKPARARKPPIGSPALDKEASQILSNAGAASLAQSEPEPTARAHLGQRRRPVAR